MTQTTTTCIHRWRIESPEGPTSMGTCQRCGATREFANYVDTPVWEASAMYTRSSPRYRGRLA